MKSSQLMHQFASKCKIITVSCIRVVRLRIYPDLVSDRECNQLLEHSEDIA